ncbi:FkbM family methyltransferase [Spirosoma litoris]
MLYRLEILLHLVKSLGLSKGVVLFFQGTSIKKKTALRIRNFKHPIILRPNTSDREVFSQVFVYKEFDIDLGFEPKTIIDGGANIGLASIYFKNKFPNATIIAVEPDKDNLDALRENLLHYTNIHIIKAGLWPRSTRLSISDKYNMGKWAMVTEEIDASKEEATNPNTIDTITIDNILTEFNLERIDLLKLDIESAEKYLFSDNYLSWLPKTKAIIIELHDWMEDGCSKPFFAAINKAFQNYSLKLSGENVVVINKDIL